MMFSARAARVAVLATFVVVVVVSLVAFDGGPLELPGSARRLQPKEAKHVSSAYGYTVPGTQTVISLPPKDQSVCIGGKIVPTLYILGADEAGTAVLGDMLVSSDRVIEALDRTPANTSRAREVHFFDGVSSKAASTEWQQLWPNCEGVNRRMVAIDATPSYLFHDKVAERLAKWYSVRSGKLQFVVLLRDPVARMQAEFYQNAELSADPVLKSPTGSQFKKYVESLLSDKWGCMGKESMRPSQCSTFWQSTYALQLTRYFKQFWGTQFIVAPSSEVGEEKSKIMAHRVLARSGIEASIGEPVPRIANKLPSLREELGDDLLEMLRKRMDEKGGSAKEIASVLTQSGAELHGYTGNLDDQEAIAAWLLAGW